jgi:hypothetical protein
MVHFWKCSALNVSKCSAVPRPYICIHFPIDLGMYVEDTYIWPDDSLNVGYMAEGGDTYGS